jgi:molecular chaperone GrpE (heat shock protein)
MAAVTFTPTPTPASIDRKKLTPYRVEGRGIIFPFQLFVDNTTNEEYIRFEFHQHVIKVLTDNNRELSDELESAENELDEANEYRATLEDELDNSVNRAQSRVVAERARWTTTAKVLMVALAILATLVIALAIALLLIV